MKILICIVLILSSLGVKCQETYNVKISLKSGAVIRGLLMKVTNDSIAVTNQKGSKIRSAAVLDIRVIGIRNSEALGTATSIGAVAGMIVGAVILNLAIPTSSSSGFPPAVQIAGLSLVGIVIGAPIGSAIGLSIGSHRKKFRLGADPEEFDRFLRRLEKVQFTNPQF